MLGPLTDDNLKDYLASFADGELAAAQSLALWEFLDGRPDRDSLIRQMREHQQLTSAARRSFRTSVPSETRDRIAALVVSEVVSNLDQPLATDRSVTPALPRMPHRRTAHLIAAAFGLIIGISATAYFFRTSTPNSVIPAALVVKVGQVHAECSRLPEAMHNATFEAVDADLATAVKAGLEALAATPDLAPAGFRFVGAGPCHGAGITTTHLLYRAVNPRSASAVSVFVQPDVGQHPALDSNRVYRVSSPTSPFPTLAWRKNKVIYILLADSEKTESVVLQIIRPTSPEQIVTIASR